MSCELGIRGLVITGDMLMAEGIWLQAVGRFSLKDVTKLV